MRNYLVQIKLEQEKDREEFRKSIDDNIQFEQRMQQQMQNLGAFVKNWDKKENAPEGPKKFIEKMNEAKDLFKI